MVNNEPTNSRKLWNKHKRELCGDKLFEAEQAGVDEESAYNTALLIIQHILESHGCTMEQFELPIPEPDELYEQVPLDLKAEINYDKVKCEKAWKAAYKLMENNRRQNEIFEELVQLIDTGNPEGKYFFVDGPGGTGKTLLFNALLNYTRAKENTAENKRHIALAVAASGIAALLLKGGRTAHNRFRLGIEVNSSTTCK